MSEIDGHYISLEQIDKDWKAILDHYDSLFDDLKRRIKLEEDFKHKEESLLWEEEAFELIWTLLRNMAVEFKASKEDIRPIVYDNGGKKIEIDFRIIIKGQPVYFDVTHFYGRPQDLKKDLKEVNIPIKDVIIGDFGRGINSRMTLSSDSNPKITTIRSHREYLNRKMVVRVAKKGKHHFKYDFIYIFIPKLDPGLGGYLDGIPYDFNFESDNYVYKQSGINGLILIGCYAEKRLKGESKIHQDKLIVNTKPLPGCSAVMTDILNKMNNVIIDMRYRIASIKSLLKTL